MQRNLSRSILSLAVLAVAGLSSSAARAQTEMAPSVVPTSLGKMRLSLDIVPAPFGNLKLSAQGQEVSGDLAFAFGIRAAFDYSINDYLFVGFGPQILFNVIGKDAPSGSDSGKQYDLSARVGGHAPIADNVHLYGFLAPGYSILSAPNPNSDAAKGFSLGIAVGALFSVPGTNFFLNGELGYHMTFLTVSSGGSSLDVNTKFPLIALGGGVKL